MTDEECRDSALKTNRLLEDINIQLASLNLIFYEDIIPSFIKTNFSLILFPISTSNLMPLFEIIF
jgi:hypothetical protein